MIFVFCEMLCAINIRSNGSLWWNGRSFNRTASFARLSSSSLRSAVRRFGSLYDVRNGEQLEREESEKLVKVLLQQHNRLEYMCRFQYQEGSIAFWDNRAVQHYAASNYYPHSRTLRRGEESFS